MDRVKIEVSLRDKAGKEIAKKIRKDKDIPAERKSIIFLISQEMGVDEQTFLNLLKVKEGTVKLSAEALNALFEDYIKEVRTLSNTVDQLTL